MFVKAHLILIDMLADDQANSNLFAKIVQTFSTN